MFQILQGVCRFYCCRPWLKNVVRHNALISLTAKAATMAANKKFCHQGSQFCPNFFLYKRKTEEHGLREKLDLSEFMEH
jgi:hypothetical protein